MAIWKEPTTAKKDAPIMTPATTAPEATVQREPEHAVDIAPTPSPTQTRRTTPSRDAKESVIAADITITGTPVSSGGFGAVVTGSISTTPNAGNIKFIADGMDLRGGINAETARVAGLCRTLQGDRHDEAPEEVRRAR